MKYQIILQARCGSSRLPGKVLEKINGEPMISWQIKRLQKTKVDNIVLATTTNEEDDELVSLARKLKVSVYRGSESDVHSRFASIAKSSKAENFIRITGDCPLFMPDLLDSMLVIFEKNAYQYLSNTNPPTFPDGLDIEIVSCDAFLTIPDRALSLTEVEHVTLALKSSLSEESVGNFENTTDLSNLRWTVDYPEDLKFVRNVYMKFTGRETDFGMDELVDLINSGKISQNEKPPTFRNIALREHANE